MMQKLDDFVKKRVICKINIPSDNNSSLLKNFGLQYSSTFYRINHDYQATHLCSLFKIHAAHLLDEKSFKLTNLYHLITLQWCALENEQTLWAVLCIK